MDSLGERLLNNDPFGGFTLAGPCGLAAQRQPAVPDHELDAVVRHDEVPLERTLGGQRDIGVVALLRRHKANVHFDGHRPH